MRNETITNENAGRFKGGLLMGVDVETGGSYTEDLILWEDPFQENFFWQAAEADASDKNCTPDGYLEGIVQKYLEFSMSDHVTNRDALKAAIKAKIHKNGELNIILGGKSIGKTKILQTMCDAYVTNKESEVMVVYVNARKDNLIYGISEALRVYAKGDWFDKIEKLDWAEIEEVSLGFV